MYIKEDFIQNQVFNLISLTCTSIALIVGCTRTCKELMACAVHVVLTMYSHMVSFLPIVIVLRKPFKLASSFFLHLRLRKMTKYSKYPCYLSGWLTGWKSIILIFMSLKLALHVPKLWVWRFAQVLCESGVSIMWLWRVSHGLQYDILVWQELNLSK